MDPSDHQGLLSISFFSLIVLNSANAICVPHNWTDLYHNYPSNLQPVSSPELPPVPSPTPTSNSPVSNLPSQAVPPSVSNPSPQAVPFVINPVSDLVPPNSFQASSLPPNSFQASSLPLITDEAIKNICHSTDYPLLCLSSIKPYVNGRNDPLSVLEMAIKASVEHTKWALFSIKRLAGTSRCPAPPSVLDDCKGSYDDALENINSALDAIPARDIGTVNSMLSAAITDFGDCEDEYSGMSSLLPVAAQKLNNMVSNCLAIVSLINDHS